MTDYLLLHAPFFLLIGFPLILTALVCGTASVTAWLVNRRWEKRSYETGQWLYEASRRNGLVTAARRMGEHWRDATYVRTVDELTKRN